MKSWILNNKTKFVLLLIVVVFLVKLVTLFTFNNTEWEPDSYMHFLELRSIFADFPQNLILGLNVWSKPLYIYPLGLIVQIFNIKDFFLIEIINTLIFILISWLVYKIVLNVYKNFAVAVVALILSSFSLTLFKSSVSVLTEPIFTLTLVGSFYFLTKKKFTLASLFIGLSVLARIEGLFFIAIYLGYILYAYKLTAKQIVKNTLYSFLPFIIWDLLGFFITGDILYFRTFFQSYSAGNYGNGTLFDYPKLFLTKEFILSTCFIIAVFFLGKYKHKLVNKKLITYSFVLFTGFVTVQAVLWSRGAFGTAGLMRYFVSVIPFLIIFICSIFVIIRSLFSPRIFILSLVIVSALQTALLGMYLTGTIVNTKEFPKVESYFVESGEWLKDNYTEETFIAADRPEILYYSQRNLLNSKIYFSDDYALRTPGIYVWTEWSPITNKITKEDIDSNASLIKEFDNKVFVYEIK